MYLYLLLEVRNAKAQEVLQHRDYLRVLKYKTHHGKLYDLTIGIPTMEPISVDFLIFPLVEELDVIGPFEVFGKLKDVSENHSNLRILASAEVTVCKHGLRILRTTLLDSENCGSILVVPGGKGTREPSEEKSAVINYIRATHNAYKIILSVCTGTFLLDEAGILKDKVCTTHTRFQKELQQKGYSVVHDRVVHHGKVITSTGVTSGIDASLYVVAFMYGKALTEQVISRIEYPFSVDEILEMVHVVPTDDQEML